MVEGLTAPIKPRSSEWGFFLCGEYAVNMR